MLLNEVIHGCLVIALPTDLAGFSIDGECALGDTLSLDGPVDMDAEVGGQQFGDGMGLTDGHFDIKGQPNFCVVAIGDQLGLLVITIIVIFNFVHSTAHAIYIIIINPKKILHLKWRVNPLVFRLSHSNCYF